MPPAALKFKDHVVARASEPLALVAEIDERDGFVLVDPNAKFHFLEVVIRDGEVSVTVRPVAEQ